MRKEVLEIKNQELAIEVTGNKISSVRNKNITKKGARVFNNGKIYSSSFVGNIDDQKLINEALENEDGAIAFDYDLEDLKEVSSEHYFKDQSKDDLYKEYENAVNKLGEKFPNFIFSGKAKVSRINKKMKVEDEANLEVNYDLCDWYFTYKHKKSASIIDGYFGAGKVGGFEIMPEIEKYEPCLNVFENEVKIEEGPTPVIFIQPTQLFRKILESARADFYKKDIGLFKGKLGEKILSEKLSLYDVSFDPEIGAMSLFDADGLVRKENRLPILENGVLKSLITDSRNAKKYSLEKTGNTRRSFDSNTILAFNSVVAGGGKRSVEDILSDLPNCIMVEMAAGGEFTDLGDYSTPVQNGFLYQNGKVVGKIPQITLTSSVEKMFGNDLIEVANEPFSGIENCPAIFTKMNVILN